MKTHVIISPMLDKIRSMLHHEVTACVMCDLALFSINLITNRKRPINWHITPIEFGHAPFCLDCYGKKIGKILMPLFSFALVNCRTHTGIFHMHLPLFLNAFTDAISQITT